jgi:hypothetical protein
MASLARAALFYAGSVASMGVVRFPKEYQEPPPSEPDQFELWPDLPAPPARDTRQTLLAEIEERFAQISAHVDAVRIVFALLEDCEAES